MRGRVRGPAIAAGTLLLTLGLMLPGEAAARPAARPADTGQVGENGVTGQDGPAGETARPAP
ncbi:hypothetical protein E1200_21515, partial [Actinomadura sp. GC306]